jgi:hypothetical protein
MGRPLPVNFVKGLAGLAGPALSLNFEGLELTQVVQNLTHSVPLIARKPTVARCYLSIPDNSTPVQVRGAIEVRDSSGVARQVLSTNVVTVKPLPAAGLRALREDITQSLNFVLPPAALEPGSAVVRLTGVSSVDGQVLSSGPVGEAPVMVNFLEMPPLRVKLFGLVYRTGTPPVEYEPTETDYQLTISWLRRVYPVADVIVSRLVIESANPWPFTCDQVNLQLAAIRRQDMAVGGDARTHYFGLVSDGGGKNFMRGCASDVPHDPSPDTVASGPAGSNTWGWDFDGSYADWYTGHELGHTFGRAHPGFCNGNSADDPAFPFADGHLSNADASFVGIDMGDQTLGLPMFALSGVTWTDVMTYCERQWMCSYTFEGILLRLRDENASFAAPLPSAGMAPFAMLPEDEMKTSHNTLVNVLASVDLATWTGRIQSVLPVARGNESRAYPNSDAVVEFLSAENQLLKSRPIRIKISSCCEGTEAKRGMIDALLALPEKATQIKLMLRGVEVDSLRTDESRPLPRTLVSLADATEVNVVGSETIRYSVQTSIDGGLTWETMATNLKSPQWTPNKNNYPGQSTILLRIIATDGFHSTSAVQKLDLS